MSCTICERRPGQRFCPAKSERICAVCCGKHREVTLDCPSDCSYLVQSRRYDADHRQPLTPEKLAFPSVTLDPGLVRERQPVVSALGFAALKFARDHAALSDSDLLAALEALAEAYRTLGSGLYYEKPPAAPLPQGLYAALAAMLNELKQAEAQHAGFPTLKDSEIFQVLVFLLRVGQHHTNGRSRSRAFLDFLREQFPPSPETAREAPRIILP